MNRTGKGVKTSRTRLSVSTKVTTSDDRLGDRRGPQSARPASENQTAPEIGRLVQPPAICFSMWSITFACSTWGLNKITSASAKTRTLWPGGQ
jgi:hypothetical protein